jgi:hypothetical protein
MTTIKPLPLEQITDELLHGGSRIAHDDPASLTDLHLRVFAAYDPGFAQSAAERREKAIREKAAAVQPVAAPSSAPATRQKGWLRRWTETVFDFITPVTAAAADGSDFEVAIDRVVASAKAEGVRHEARMLLPVLGFLRAFYAKTKARFEALEKRVAELAPAAGGGGDSVAAAIDQLKKRIDELERRPSVDYKGVWEEKGLYGRGSVVTWAGSCWYAKDASVSRRPGTDPSAWVLMVKRGADGKDAR